MGYQRSSQRTARQPTSQLAGEATGNHQSNEMRDERDERKTREALEEQT